MTDIDRIAAQYRELPSVDRFLEEEGLADDVPRVLLRSWIRDALAEARETLDAARTAASRGEAATIPAEGRESWTDWVRQRIGDRATQRDHGVLRRVINATGILIHTNLGRAPLAPPARDAYLESATGYCNLEMDLVSGKRSSRLGPIMDLIPKVTGAEAGFAVHNTAAAVFLTLSALARGREVVVSRAHLVEIGGSFRLPDIMEAAGVRLVEVGATNRTRISDYADRIGPDTALILKVHPSNFKMVGFTEEASSEDLAALGREHGVPFFEDLGSGALDQHGELTFGEPRVQDSLRAGADIAAFSGDKLLGAPQGGILVGKKTWIDRLRSHPVARVVRLDKTALAALERTLEMFLLPPEELRRKVPLVRMLAAEPATLENAAMRLRDRLRSTLGQDWTVDVVKSVAEVGGGSLPGQELESRAVSVVGPLRPDDLSLRLRTGTPSIVGRIEGGRFLLDVRTLLEGDEDDLVAAMEGLR